MTVEAIRIRDGAREQAPARPRRIARIRARVPWRRVLVVALVLTGLGCVVAGVALIYPPAGLIATGIALFAALTFDPAAARKVTWPR